MNFFEIVIFYFPFLFKMDGLRIQA